MAALSDSIENFIKDLMEADTQVELKRNELATYFGCAPSQINYVLATRFSMDRGYIVESHRGGSGYVRVIRIEPSRTDLLDVLMKRIGTAIDDDSACTIILRLYDLGLITAREADILQSAVSCEAISLPISAKDMLRASILKNCVLTVFKNLKEGI